MKKATLSFSERVTHSRARPSITIDAALHGALVKKFARGNAEYTNATATVEQQKMLIHKRKDRGWTIQTTTITVIGPYLQVKDDKGGGLGTTPTLTFYKP